VGPRDLIIYGTENQENDYPYLAYLVIQLDENTTFCGGTLIDPNWILTTASCVDTALNITAWLGVHNISSVNVSDPGVEYHFIYPDDIYIYPGYDSKWIDGDFALLYLSNGSNKTIPVLNPDIFVPAEKDTVWVSGWGDLLSDDNYASYPSVPMEVSLEVVGRDACELAYADSFTITNDMLCATGWGEGSACNGDSGGPVVMKDPNGDHSKDVLVGVVSWAKPGCNYPNWPTVFARVSSALSWFLSMMPSEMALAPP